MPRKASVALVGGSFDAAAAAEQARNALKGLGTDEKKLDAVVARCTFAQREQIAAAYKSKFSRDLRDDIKDDTSGNYQDLMLALFDKPAALAAKQLRDQIDAENTLALLGTLVLIAPGDIAAVRSAFEAGGASLPDAVAGVVSGPLQSVAAAWATGSREASTTINRDEAASMAAQLHSEEAKMFADDSLLLTSLTVLSPAQLFAVSQEYAKVAGYDLAAAAAKIGPESVAKAMKLIVAAAENPAAAAADVLHGAMEGLGTDNKTLIFVFASRLEVDLQTIAEQYLQRHSTTLVSDVKGDTSSDFENVLVTMLG